MRDTQKVREFVKKVTKLKHNQSVKQTQLEHLVTKDFFSGKDGLSNPDERYDENVRQSVQNNQLLFDVMKSKLSKNVHSVTSQHLAVG